MKIYKAVVWLVVALAILLVVLLAGVRLFGLTPYTVLSGSMEPAYKVGSVIYVTKVDPSTLKVKDPITFVLDGTTVTHRIIEIEDKGGLRFYTRGDANNTPDGGFVTPEEVIGKPVFHIPLLGYISYYVQHPPGLYIVVGAVLVLVILSFLQPVEEEKTEKTEN